MKRRKLGKRRSPTEEHCTKCGANIEGQAELRMYGKPVPHICYNGYGSLEELAKSRDMDTIMARALSRTWSEKKRRSSDSR